MFIYVLAYDNLRKVGVSTNPQKRKEAFPFMKLIYSKKIDNAFFVENFLKKEFNHKNVGGEFFNDISDDILNYLKDQYENKKEQIDLLEFDFAKDKIFVDKKTGYINITKFFNTFHKIIFDNDEKKETKKILQLRNIFNNKSIKLFISSMETKDITPYYSFIGRNIGKYVHPFLFVEIINTLNIPILKIEGYKFFLEKSFITSIAIKKAKDII
jgi:hypothetical protein